MRQLEIVLTQGKVALVDEDDFENVKKFKWTYDYKGYAYRKENKTSIFMHRFIMKQDQKNSLKVDHIDGNGLNNSKSNLRICTHSQNLMNQRLQKDPKKTSKYKGVYFNKDKGKWQVQIRSKYIGRFKTEKEAALAYNKCAQDSFGEYARINSEIL